jgi:hypothetical protein
VSKLVKMSGYAKLTMRKSTLLVFVSNHILMIQYRSNFQIRLVFACLTHCHCITINLEGSALSVQKAASVIKKDAYIACQALIGK